MKAFALESADHPAALIDVPTPDLGDTDVRVAVRAASINGFDVFQASGYLVGMMPHTFPTTIGRDMAGVIDAVGAGAAGFAQGDAVIGFIPSTPPLHHGTLAESVVGGPELVLVHKPADLDFDAAAALPLAGSAALDLLEAVGAKPGDTILVVGATGGVGSLLVQLAKLRGSRVIATARPDEDAFVRGLGADETIDYSAGDVAPAVRARYPDGVAALVDLVDQAEGLTALTSLVRSGGHVASLLGAADVDALAAAGITGDNVMAAPTTDKLTALAELAASGALRVPIQATFELDAAADAIAAFQAGTRGKIIVRVAAP